MKKELKSIQVGDLTVFVQVRTELVRGREDEGEEFIAIGAQCGMTQGDTSLSMHPSADHTAESLQRDIDERVKHVAEETAARERARLLREALFQS